MATLMSAMVTLLGQDLDDGWIGTTTAQGAADKLVLEDDALYEKIADWVSDGMVLYLPDGPSGSGSAETRVVDTLSGTSLTVKTAFSVRIESGVSYEVHRLFTRNQKLVALRNSATLICPGIHAVVRDMSKQTVDDQYEFDISSLSIYQNRPHQVLLAQQIIRAIWVKNTTYEVGDYVRPTSLSAFTGLTYKCTTSEKVYESYVSGTDFWGIVYGANWRSQTFTPSSAHTIIGVKLGLIRFKTPGTVTVSIKAVDGDSKPTGDDLCSGTIDGDSLPTTYDGLQTILFSSTYALSSGTKYAIVVRAVDGTGVTDAVWWAKDNTGSYSGGSGVLSTDSGSTWTVDAEDLMFEEYSLGVSDSSEPTWPTGSSGTVSDGTVIWTRQDNLDYSNYPMVPLHDWDVTPDGKLFLNASYSAGYNLMIVGIKPLAFTGSGNSETLALDSPFTLVLSAEAALYLHKQRVNSVVGQDQESAHLKVQNWTRELAERKAKYWMKPPDGTLITGPGLTV